MSNNKSQTYNIKGDKMNLFFIEKYIQKITKDDIFNYASREGISLTNDELNILYNFLKTNYKEFLTNKNSQPKLLEEIKSKVPVKTANKLEELYNLYKNKL